MKHVEGRLRRKEKLVKHPFEDQGPTQERYVVNDDNWKLAETALPYNHEKVDANPGEFPSMTGARGRPMTDDLASDAIHHSTSGGRK